MVRRNYRYQLYNPLLCCSLWCRVQGWGGAGGHLRWNDLLCEEGAKECVLLRRGKSVVHGELECWWANTLVERDIVNDVDGRFVLACHARRIFRLSDILSKGRPVANGQGGVVECPTLALVRS